LDAIQERIAAHRINFAAEMLLIEAQEVISVPAVRHGLGPSQKIAATQRRIAVFQTNFGAPVTAGAANIGNGDPPYLSSRRL
jgi:hypothetical protein